jgi:uncharacterized membrane protein
MIPNHPQLVHLPLVLSFVMPILSLVFVWFLKTNKMHKNAWIILVGFQICIVATAYISLETGETEEDKVERLVGKKNLHSHEEKAEIFVATAVLSLSLLIVTYFIKAQFQFYAQLLTVLSLVITSITAYGAGQSGFKLVYQFAAASAYTTPIQSDTSQEEGLLPTPGKNTSESEFPTEDNNEYDDEESDETDEETSEDED